MKISFLGATDGVTGSRHLVDTGTQALLLVLQRLKRGRVLHHLKAMAPDPRHAIVLPGCQASGTRDARLLAREREVKINGEWVAVRAEVSQLQGFSGHADADELVDWARRLHQPPRRTFVVHGEPDAADTLRARIQRDLGWTVRVPGCGETVEI